MKQHIIEEQLKELSKEAKSKLEDIINKNPITKEIPENKFQWDIDTFQINIGWMIEFLDDLDLEVCISKPHLTQYDVSIYDKYTDKVTLDIDEGFYQSEELCDALWEAVKEVLNKD